MSFFSQLCIHSVRVMCDSVLEYCIVLFKKVMYITQYCVCRDYVVTVIMRTIMGQIVCATEATHVSLM